MFLIRPTFAFAVVLLGLQSFAVAAIINGFNPARHERYLSDETPNPNFLMDESKLSGVAIRQAVLITPRHYVAAAHVSTPEVTFRGTDGVRRTYQSVSSQSLVTAVPGQPAVASDIRLHTLASEVDASIVPVPVVVGDLDALIGQTLFAMDLGMRAGRNTIDAIGIVEFESGNGDTVAMQFSYDTDTNGGVGGLGIDEIGLIGGDSGNAALIDIDGQIALLGTHMGIDVPPGSSPGAGDRYDSFSTLVGAYEDEISAIVAADGYTLSTITITAIPEPSAAMLLGAIAVSGLFRRRTRPSV